MFFWRSSTSKFLINRASVVWCLYHKKPSSIIPFRALRCGSNFCPRSKTCLAALFRWDFYRTVLSISLSRVALNIRLGWGQWGRWQETWHCFGWRHSSTLLAKEVLGVIKLILCTHGLNEHLNMRNVVSHTRKLLLYYECIYIL